MKIKYRYKGLKKKTYTGRKICKSEVVEECLSIQLFGWF